jgi:uncharacterized membrane protein YdjX (TVP38/TMEM64 family)
MRAGWIALLAVLVAAGCALLCGEGLDAEAVAARQRAFFALRDESPLLFGAAFFAAFALLAALAVPGCGVLALAAGACWGVVGGTLVVTLASTFGATLSFLAARHLCRDAVQRRFGHLLAPIERHLARDGALLVFWLRLAPVVPFPVLNPLLGVTRLSAARFFASSALGMLAGSAAYAWAGASLGSAAQWHDVLSLPVAGALVVLAALPLAARRFGLAPKVVGDGR